MILHLPHVVAEFRVPWRRYHGKGTETSVQVRVTARGRWRWGKVALTRPAPALRSPGVFSWSLEAKSWLTDESLRGNLERKVFVRFKFRAGIGARAKPGPCGCPSRGVRGQPCTWEKWHVPMLVTWPNRAEQLEVPHSFACPKLAGPYEIVQEPRRKLTEREFIADVERQQGMFAELWAGVLEFAANVVREHGA